MFGRTLKTCIVACSVLLAMVFATPASPGDRTALCHATGSGHFNFLNLPPEPLDNHMDGNGSPISGHENDFFPVDGDCDRTNDPPGGDPGPGAVPEPITILLFGAGVAGVGYASRRIRRNRASKTGSE